MFQSVQQARMFRCCLKWSVYFLKLLGEGIKKKKKAKEGMLRTQNDSFFSSTKDYATQSMYLLLIRQL